jgi:hypothetical protein
MRGLTLLGGALAMTVTLTSAAQAQDTAETRRLTIMTFSAPVQLPGKTLPAGKYRFEMADINNAAHTVRVLSEDGTEVFGTFSTIPTVMATRDLTSQDTLVMFAERAAGSPQAAKEWYYPGRSTGEEFIYPKAQAIAIAQANNTSVAAFEDNSNQVIRVDGSGAVSGSNSSQAEQSVARAETPAQAPAATEPAPASGANADRSESAPVGTSGQSPAAQTDEPSRPARTELPRTAGHLTLLQLLSGLSLAGALGVRQIRKHIGA